MYFFSNLCCSKQRIYDLTDLFSKFSDVLPAFTYVSAISDLCSTCLSVNVLISVPRVCFLIGIFEGVDHVFLLSSTPITFIRNILPLKGLRTFSLPLKRSFFKFFFFRLVFCHAFLFLFYRRIYFALLQHHLLITSFDIYLLKIQLVIDKC